MRGGACRPPATTALQDCAKACAHKHGHVASPDLVSKAPEDGTTTPPPPPLLPRRAVSRPQTTPSWRPLRLRGGVFALSGLVPQCPIDEQNSYDAMHMRTLVGAEPTDGNSGPVAMSVRSHSISGARAMPVREAMCRAPLLLLHNHRPLPSLTH